MNSTNDDKSGIAELIDRGLFHKDKAGKLMENTKGHFVPDYSEWADWVAESFNVLTSSRDILIYEAATGRFIEGTDQIRAWMEQQYPFFSTRDFVEIFEHVRNRTYFS